VGEIPEELPVNTVLDPLQIETFEPALAVSVQGGGTQDMLALKPELTTEKSEVNRMVKGPTVEVNTGGNEVQFPLKSVVPPVPAPLNTVTKSQQHSKENEVKVKRTILPAVAGLIIVNPLALLL